MPPPKKNKIVEEEIVVNSDDVDKKNVKLMKPFKPIILKKKISVPEPIIKEVINPIDDEEIKPNLNPIRETKPNAKPNTKPKLNPKDEDTNESINPVSINPLKVHQHSKPKKIISSKQTESSFDMFGDDDVDFRFVMMNYDYTKNKTLPKITKYEKALLIGKRAKQIEEGANANIKVLPGQSAIEIAEEELRQRKIPLIIKRPIGNTFEYWKPADMEVFMD